MKTYKYIFSLLIAAVLVSCSDFLDEDPKTFLSPDNSFKTLEDVEMGLNAIYRTPQDRYSNEWAAPNWFGWATDCGELTSANGHAAHNDISYLRTSFNSSSDVPWWMWDYIYRHVKDINALLENMTKVEMDQKTSDRIEAQARAFRAHLFFDAVRIFGPVPLMLETESSPSVLNAMTRTDEETVYNAIIEDLKFGVEHLPTEWTNSVDAGRLTSGACAALLARVYVTMAGYPLKKTEKWQDARAILKAFVEDKTYGAQYGLFDEYADAFLEENIPGKESVWTINFTRSSYGQGSDLHTNFAPIELYYDSRCGLTRGGGWSNELPTDAFLASYDKTKDKRYAATYWASTADFPLEYEDINTSSTGPVVFAKPHVKKFREKTPNNNSLHTGIDHYIIRYADVLLMYAEVLNELDDNSCYTYINMVRNRAGLNDLPAMDKEQFRDAALMERGWELCFEGERRFELVRAGEYYNRVKAWNTQAGPNIVEGKHELWPIPQRERDINMNLTQNKGY